jgi:hypothetical protein
VAGGASQIQKQKKDATAVVERGGQHKSTKTLTESIKVQIPTNTANHVWLLGSDRWNLYKKKIV